MVLDPRRMPFFLVAAGDLVRLPLEHTCELKTAQEKGSRCWTAFAITVERKSTSTNILMTGGWILQISSSLHLEFIVIIKIVF